MRLTTARLVIDPLVEADAAPFAAIAGDARVAPMLGSFRVGFTPEEALERIRRNTRGAAPGFRLALREGGALAGTVGMAPPDEAGACSVMYFLAPARRGRGLAREAMAAFVPAILARFDPAALTATAFEDNPASQRVLAGAGFQETCRGPSQSAGRVGAVPAIFYRLPHREAQP